MGDYLINTEPENKKYSLFQSHSSTCTAFETEIEITAMCSFSDLLFIGTSKGLVSQLIVQELYEDKTSFCLTDVLSRRIFTKPILRLETSSRKTILSIFSDENLTLLNAENLEIINFIPSFKGVSSFHLCSFDDEKERLCIGFKSGLIQLHHIFISTCMLVFETRLTEVSQSLCISPQFICAALNNSYISINLSTSGTTELLRSVGEPVRSFVAHFTQNEFIVSGPGSLAIIVDANGISHRAPLQLSPNVVEVFVWRNYFFTITDEFFTIHNIITQSQIQTLNLQKSSVACFSTDTHLLYFAGTSDSSTTRIENIQIVGPERWDLIARRFILTDCLKQAFNVQQQERNRIIQVMKVQAEKFKHEQQLFNMRRQRVLGLLGFYYFEKAELEKAATHFEQSTIDIREILFRYTDLLPKGCYFMPNWFYRLHQTNPETGDSDNYDQTSGINLVSDLCILRASENLEIDNDNSTLNSSWLLKYEEFLFNFLRKHHKSKFVEKYLHFVETALVKLYVRLQQAGIQPYLYELIIDTSFSRNSQSREGHPTKSTSDNDQGLVDLISSLIHIDVDDLTVYLEKNNAYHALALIYRWQGNLSGALEIWRKLVYGELNDTSFPGVEFYVSILTNLSASNISSDSQNHSPHKMMSITHSPNDFNYEFPVYAELVWSHFMQALTSNHEEIAEQLMLQFPIPESYINSSSALCNTEKDAPKTSMESSLAPSQILSPNHIIQNLISSYPHLAMTYLKHLCSSLPNCHPENHNLLAKLYLNTVLMKLKSTDSLSDEMTQQIRNLRIEFCQLIRYSLLISHEALLERLNNESATVRKKLVYELALLEGKANNHVKALKHLIEDINDYKAAFYYCLTFSNQHSIQNECENDNSVMVDTSNIPHHCDQYEFMKKLPNNQSVSSLLFTTFVDICLDRLFADENNTNDIKKIILSVLNNPDLKFNYSKLLSRLPSTWNLLEIKLFLQNALRSTLQERSKLYFEYGLTKYNAKLSVSNLPSKSYCLVIEDDTFCSICHQSIRVYGPSNSFAWLISTNQVVHTHCLSSNR
ncbi:Transforming growth factor-beta receptor-associated protein [Schistosoma japonicum]|uniref:Transforming growth factor-beta receptor-associated protein n=1 Tax=Schistosoma japonicum TaxID=6182 RepID=A0A4Z2DXN9_SCHJA|nr:Transforming growth factor-beta receptor-associated protein [Schistosoma japonicum]